MLKHKLSLALSLAFGLTAAVLVWYQLRSHRLRTTAGWELKDIIVAKTDLEPGSIIDTAAATTDQMPARFVYENVLSPKDMGYARGREVVVPIKQGEPIHWYQLRGIRALERLSRSVRKGWRGISVSVSDRSSVGQWVRPNDAVDILGTFRDPSTSELISVTLLQNVLVLATGQTTGGTQGTEAQGRYNNLTLLVLPEEAEFLVLAQDLGSLSFTLRNLGDNSVSEERTRTNIQTLLTGERVKKLRQQRQKTIRIIRGVGSRQRRK